MRFMLCGALLLGLGLALGCAVCLWFMWSCLWLVVMVLWLCCVVIVVFWWLFVCLVNSI